MGPAKQTEDWSVLLGPRDDLAGTLDQQAQLHELPLSKTKLQDKSAPKSTNVQSLSLSPRLSLSTCHGSFICHFTYCSFRPGHSQGGCRPSQRQGPPCDAQCQLSFPPAAAWRRPALAGSRTGEQTSSFPAGLITQFPRVLQPTEQTIQVPG